LSLFLHVLGHNSNMPRRDVGQALPPVNPSEAQAPEQSSGAEHL
jgi:hypothetical protein